MIQLSHAFGVLAQDGQAHGDVEPVENMLTTGTDEFSEGATLFAAIRALI